MDWIIVFGLKGVHHTRSDDSDTVNCLKQPNPRVSTPCIQPDSDFERRVSTQGPSTGQLLRWRLRAGDNLDVMVPPDLSRIVAAQTRKAAAL